MTDPSATDASAPSGASVAGYEHTWIYPYDSHPSSAECRDCGAHDDEYHCGGPMSRKDVDVLIAAELEALLNEALLGPVPQFIDPNDEHTYRADKLVGLVASRLAELRGEAS